MEKQKNTRNIKLLSIMSQLSILGVTQRKKLSINLIIYMIWCMINLRHTTLNTILSQSDEIVSLYESNQAGDSRKRLTKANNDNN